MAPVSSSTVIAILTTLLPLFFRNDPTEQEILTFITAVSPFFGPNAPKSGTIPAIRVGSEMFGPIPFGPVS